MWWSSWTPVLCLQNLKHESGMLQRGLQCLNEKLEELAPRSSASAPACPWRLLVPAWAGLGARAWGGHVSPRGHAPPTHPIRRPRLHHDAGACVPHGTDGDTTGQTVEVDEGDGICLLIDFSRVNVLFMAFFPSGFYQSVGHWAGVESYLRFDAALHFAGNPWTLRSAHYLCMMQCSISLGLVKKKWSWIGWAWLQSCVIDWLDWMRY